MKKVLQRPNTAGRLAEWVMKLSEFDIRYESQTALKAQVLADFAVEFVGLEPEPMVQLERWEIYIDGASFIDGVGVGILIKWPGKLMFQYAVKHDFSVTNNVAEYEALIKGLELIKEISPDRILIRGDSRLVTGKINKSFQTKDESMGKYMAKAKTVLTELESKGILWHLEYIPREQNELADG